MYLHFGEEPINAGDCIEENVGGKIVPNLQAAKYVCRPIPHAARDGRRLNDIA